MRMTLKQRVCGALCTVDNSDSIPAGWLGGKTSFMLAKELNVSIHSVRQVLRELTKENRVVVCAPRKYHRHDGHTGQTFVYWLVEKEA